VPDASWTLVLPHHMASPGTGRLVSHFTAARVVLLFYCRHPSLHLPFSFLPSPSPPCSRQYPSTSTSHHVKLIKPSARDPPLSPPPPPPPFSILTFPTAATKPPNTNTRQPRLPQHRQSLQYILATAQCCWPGRVPSPSDSSLFRPIAPNPTLGFCPRKPDHPANPP